MAKRRRRRIRRKPKEEVVEEEDVVEEEEEELSHPPVESRRRKPRKIDDEEEEELPEESSEDEPEDEPEAEATGDEGDDEYEIPAEVEIRKVDKVVAENIFEELFEHMRDGEALLVARDGDNWKLTLADAAKVGMKQKLKGKEYHDTVRSEEFKQWNEEWKQKTDSEKKKHAKKIGATWEEHENERINMLRVTLAVRKKEGIEKYKPEFRTRSARAAIRA